MLIEIKDETDTAANGVNEVLKRTLKDFWTITPVEYLNTNAYNEALANEGNKYAVLLAYDDESSISVKHYSTTKSMKQNVPGNPSAGSSMQADGLPKHTSSTKFYFSHYNLSVSLMNGKIPGTQVCTIAFANENINTSDLQFAIQQMARVINASLSGIKGLDYYDHKKNIEFVKTKTLLIPTELFKEADLLKLKDSYKMPYRIVSLDEMNELALTRDDQYIYPKIIYSVQHRTYGWITVGPKEGNVTSFMAFGGFKFNTTVKANEVIKTKDLNYIASSMAQGINNKYK